MRVRQTLCGEVSVLFQTVQRCWLAESLWNRIAHHNQKKGSLTRAMVCVFISFAFNVSLCFSYAGFFVSRVRRFQYQLSLHDLRLQGVDRFHHDLAVDELDE